MNPRTEQGSILVQGADLLAAAEAVGRLCREYI